MEQSHLAGTFLFECFARSEVRGELNVRCPKPTGWKQSMKLYYMGIHLNIFSIAHLHEKIKGKRTMKKKMVHSQPTLILFVSKE